MSTASVAFITNHISSPKVPAMRSTLPSVSDYANFHGMLCSPSTTSRCIDSFDTVLFLPSSYTPSTACHSGALTFCSYYMLVFVSLTGLSTLLGWTEVRMARDYSTTAREAEPSIASEYNPLLRVEPHVLEFCKHQSNANSIFLQRRFEYQFRLVGLEVLMLHFLCDQNKLHLVEIYHFNHWMWNDWVAPLISALGKSYQEFLEGRDRSKKE